MRRQTCRIRRRRSGLAPLELTLALPLLLMAMALMVLVGTAGAWRVRTNVNSRQAIFRSMWPRTTDQDPNPQSWWPASASMSYHGGGASPLDSDPFVDHTVVRGPVVTDPETGNLLTVQIDTLDMTDGMSSGRAEVDHEPAMWPQLGARNRFSRETVLFAGQTWQYGNMGIPSNQSRRIEYTYDYELSKYNPQAAARTLAARDAILANPERPALMVLDCDAELRAWYGDYVDFHPRPGVSCISLDDLEDPIRLRQIVLDPLLDRIERVPERMAQTFLSMYQAQLQALLQSNPGAAQQIADLQEKIRQLQDFLATL
jgi:hypothetical protein